MKTKIILLVALVVILFSFSSGNNEPAKSSKAQTKKTNSAETPVNKGLAMEDKDQFN